MESSVVQPVLEIRLFGTVDVRVHGCPLRTLRTRQGYWLLALLVLSPHNRRSRIWLAEQLWPRSEATSALANLRRALTDLRSALGPERDRLSSPDHDNLAVDLLGATVDVHRFNAAIVDGDVTDLAREIDLYRASLLKDCDCRWIRAERTAYHEQYLEARERLASHYLAGNCPADALPNLICALDAEPTRESCVRLLMRAHACREEWGMAYRAYQELCRRLKRDYATTPEDETRALFFEIQARARHESRSKQNTQRNLVPLLPLPNGHLFGREEAVRDIVSLLRTERLITLTGCGGGGKTQLALLVAHAYRASVFRSVWFADMSAIDDPALAIRVIADSVQVRASTGEDLEEAVLTYLSAQSGLLVLDNCEHLASATVRLVRLFLRSCPEVYLLTTSRQPLGVREERQWRVPQLRVPPVTTRRNTSEATCAVTLEWLLNFDAVRLFVDRAARVRPGFVLTAGNAMTVSRICQRLDGIPLAIELVSARMNVLTPPQILKCLEDGGQFLDRGDPTAPSRQQTLQATLDWSYSLLSEAEQTCMLALSVLSGGWTLDAALAVCAPVCGGAVFDLLGQLVDKSLVHYEAQEGAGRYRFLETIRAYVRQLCERAQGLYNAMRHHHLAYFVGWAEMISTSLAGRDQALWIAAVETDIENVRAALNWAIECHQASQGMRLACALWRFWYIRGDDGEGLRYLTRLLTLAPRGDDPLRLRTVGAAGNLAYQQKQFDRAQELYTEQLALAESLAEERVVASALGNLANLAADGGRDAEARDLLRQVLSIHRRLGDRRGIALTLDNLAILACQDRDFPGACTCHEESILLLEQEGDMLHLSIALHNLAEVKLLQGDYSAVEALLARSLPLCRDLAYNSSLLHGLLVAVSLAVERRQDRRASQLVGSCETLTEVPELLVSVQAHRALCDFRSELMVRVGEREFEHARQRGRMLDIGQAIQVALWPGEGLAT